MMELYIARQLCMATFLSFSISLLSHLTLIAGDSTWSQWDIKQVQSTWKLSHTWTIRNFSLYKQENSHYFISPISPSTNNRTWYLKLYPRGENDTAGNFISLFLMYESDNFPTLQATFKLVVLNKYNKTARELSEPHTFSDHVGFGTAQMINRNYVMNPSNGILVDDTLTIYTEIDYVIKKVVNIAGSCLDSKYNSVLHQQYSDHLEHLLKSEEYSDVTLLIKDKELRAHRAILSSYSPVFASLFKNITAQELSFGLEDCEKGTIVQITDIDLDVMKEALRYMYTGRVQLVSNKEIMARKLLSVAHKYKIEGLKNVCAEMICRDLDIPNATDVLIVADSSKSEELKSKAMSLIVDHIDHLQGTSKFNTFQRENADLALEVFKAIAFKTTLRKKPVSEARFYGGNTRIYDSVHSSRKQQRRSP